MIASLAEPVTRFHDLALQPALLDAVDRAGFEVPSEIQTAFIPEALAGRDVMGQAQTGTGKTAAFLLPILQGIREDAPTPQALILAPTRELVVQIAAEAEKLSHCSHIRTLAIVGGERFRGQLDGLRRGSHIIVGTPGRLIDHLQRGTLVLEHIRFVVLDEADRMLDIGFRPAIENILRRCPKRRQTFLLSATVPPQVQRLARRYMHDPVVLNTSPEKLAVDAIHQTYITVDARHKFDLLLRVIEREQPRQCIIFTETKRGADRLHHDLKQAHKHVATIHGDLPQEKRNRIMAGFREGKITFLVATDVVGRGIDVTGISHIINYDLPHDPENYVHRIGRTGRMGSDGRAIAFSRPDQGELLTAIENLMNQLIEEDFIEGFDAVERRREPRHGEKEKPAAPAVPMFGRRVKRYSRAL